jgi:hypothetical protein
VVSQDIFNIRGTYTGRGGYLIGGHSLGGLNAITAAYHLEAMGCEVDTVRALSIDALPCTDHMWSVLPLHLCGLTRAKAPHSPCMTDGGVRCAYFQLALIDSPFPTYINEPEIMDEDELAAELAKYYLEGCVAFSFWVVIVGSTVVSGAVRIHVRSPPLERLMRSAGACRYNLEMPASLDGASSKEQRRIIVDAISDSVGLPLDMLLNEVSCTGLGAGPFPGCRAGFNPVGIIIIGSIRPPACTFRRTWSAILETKC